MTRNSLITLLGATLVAGCGDGAMLGSAPITPKHAAELCTAWEDEDTKPSPEQAKIVATYRAGEITFNECMRRLRG